tara:strand:+ start:285 stop:1112 length:828 start_codon:yes stop_codon:yes gene_type:complete
MYKEDIGHLLRLKNAGFNPEVVFDIGVSNGEFFYSCQQVFTDAKYFLFEARKKSQTEISETLVNVDVKYKLFFDTLLGGTNREVDFHEIDAGSSIYKEATKFAKTNVKKQMVTLKNLIANTPMLEKATEKDVPRFLKIDTQGSELQILAGMEEYIEKFEVVQLEVALLEYNLGAPLVADVMQYMDRTGFALYDIGPFYRRETDFAIFHMDFVFVAKRSKLRDKKAFWHMENCVPGIKESLEEAVEGYGTVDPINAMGGWISAAFPISETRVKNEY